MSAASSARSRSGSRRSEPTSPPARAAAEPLVRQDRPNVFRTTVANIGPGETIEITIEFQQIADFDGTRFRLRFPTVVAPRYGGSASPLLLAAGVEDTSIPRTSRCEVVGEAAWSEIELATLALSDPFAPPQTYIGSSPHALAHDVAAAPSLPSAVSPDRGSAPPSFLLTVDLEPGFPLAEIASPYHAIEAIEISSGRYGVGLVDERGGADRDFELVWEPALGRLPQTTLLAEEYGGELYALLMMLPPDRATGGDLRLPRESVFVVDTSGSMGGPSMVKAKAALRFALDQLRPEDTFNLIRFDSEAEALFDDSAPVSARTLAEAESWVDGLSADGGTEMLPALELAFEHASGAYSVRQVIFVTDGSISNEASLLAEIELRLGDSRLFTVGIGSAPNAYFMRKAAELGRGTFTFISDPHEVESRMSELFDKLAHPILSDLEVVWPDATAEVWPERLPDLYLGEPLVVVARMRDLDALAGGAAIELRGRRGGTVWSETLPLPEPTAESGIEKLWARQRIGSLMDRYSTGREPDAMRLAVLETALDHHLVSRFTSLVAVDKTPSAAPPPQATRPIPLALPHGWEPPFDVGNLPQTATPAPLLLLLGMIALAGGALLLLPSLRGGST